MALFYMRLLLIFCLRIDGYIFTESASSSKVVIDVSQVIRDAIDNKQVAREALLAIALANKGKYPTVLMFYEMDLRDENAANLDKVGTLLTELQTKVTDSQLKLLVSFRNAKFNDFINDPDYAEVRRALEKYPSLFTDISFHSGITGNLCIQNVNNSENSIEEIKLANPSVAYLKIGYGVKLENNQCGSHTEMMKQADFIIINKELKINDNKFVESFGIFKENMENVIALVQKSDLEEIFVNKTIFYRLILDATINRKSINTSMEFLKETEDISLVEDEHLLENSGLLEHNQITAQRYQQLFTSYIYEWVENRKGDDDIKVIITFAQGYPITNYSNAISAWMPTHTKIIPFLTSLVVSGNNGSSVSSTLSANILLKDIATAGFHTVMINGQIWNKLVQNKDHQQCQSYWKKCQPNEVIYRVDNYRPFDSPLSEKIKPMLVFGGMRMESFNFPHVVYTQMRPVIKAFYDAIKSDTKPTTGRILCGTWSGNILECSQGCVDKIAQQHAIGCGSEHSLTDGFVWNLTINLNEEIMENIVETIMMRLDAFVIARHAPTVKYPKRKVSLHIKCLFTGDAMELISNSRAKAYCNSLDKRVGLFYEMILTWARIHDFTLILEQAGDVTDVGNPLALKRLTTTDINPLHQLMESVPIFVRRTYNESMVFGSWTEGMHPCIAKMTSVRGFSFDQEFSGVTLNLNLRQDSGSSITTDEIQTLLLFALQKFEKVEIILASNHFEPLSDAVSNSEYFEKILDMNKITKEKQIYLQIQNPFSEADQEKLNVTILSLEYIGFTVYITLSADMGDQIDHLDKTFEPFGIGIVHRNCSSLAYDTVYKNDFEAKENLLKVNYLVCEMPSISADNGNEEEMQSHFDTHLYLKKLLQHAYPKLKHIHFRLHSTFAGNTSRNQTENLFRFLADFNNYAYAYRIHYFLLPAFAKENNTDMETSLWEIKNYVNLADPAVFNDIMAIAMEENTWRPKFQNDDEHSSERSGDESSYYVAGIPKEMFLAFLIISLIIVSVVLVVLVKRRLDQNFLSVKEIQDFMYGRQETLKEASRLLRRKKRFPGSIFDGLVFQMEYALAKEDLDMNSKILVAEGKYSNVYKVKLKDSPDEVAVKVSKKNYSKEIFKGMLSEVKLLCYLGDHRNIVSFIGCYKKEINRGILWVVMEFRDGGNLLSYLKGRSANERDEQSFQELVRFSHEIASGMEWIAGQNIVHGDLCAENVLMNRYNKCKIKCFGLSRKQQEYYVHMKKNHMEKISAWRWMAPESLRKLEFTNQSDVWSYGVTIWEIFNLGEIPHSGILRVSKLIEDVESGKHLKIPDYATEEIYNIMLECWKVEPDRRPDFPLLLKFFTHLMPQNVEKSNQ